MKFAEALSKEKEKLQTMLYIYVINTRYCTVVACQFIFFFKP